MVREGDLLFLLKTIDVMRILTRFLPNERNQSLLLSGCRTGQGSFNSVQDSLLLVENSCHVSFSIRKRFVDERFEVLGGTLSCLV
jgi:hypothetical protein